MKLTNALNLPQPFVSAAESDYVHTDRRYSVTSILKGTREAILQRRHADEIELDVADMVWAIFGTAVHSILQNAQETETQLKENFVCADVSNGYQLSGVFDLYDDATGTVTDYKTASIWKVKFNEFDDWRMQVLAYCWLLRQMGFDAHRGEVVAMLKDHSKTKAAVEAGYPPHPVMKVGWEFYENDFVYIGAVIDKKFAEIEAAEKLPDDQLPLCSKEERWGKDDVWAVTKRGNKRAAKLHDNEADAIADAEARASREGKPYDVDFRPGEDAKCKSYCSACEFCDHYLANVKEA